MLLPPVGCLLLLGVAALLPAAAQSRIVNTPSGPDGCVDVQGNRHQIGEEWTVRNHFVMLCHEVSAEGVLGRVRLEVVACVRDDGTRMGIGEEAQEAQGVTVLCHREGNSPTGQVRREYRLSGQRVFAQSAGEKEVGTAVDGGGSGIAQRTVQDAKEKGCFGRAEGSRFQLRSFELECTSQFALPKLVACLVPELNGQRVAVGETADGGQFKVTCEQMPNGNYAYRSHF